MSALPTGWAQARLEDVVILKTGPFGSALHKSDYIIGGTPLINPSHIHNGSLCPDPNVSIDEAAGKRLSEFWLRCGDVVMARRGEMGRCAVVPRSGEGWLCGTGSVIVRPTGALKPEFLQRYLSAPTTVERLTGDSVGSTMVNLNQRVLLALPVSLPPIKEQQLIADKLDTVLARVDASRDRLARVVPLLKRFRQSVLAAATSGLLTEEWRENKDASVWQQCTIGEVTGSSFYGPRFSATEYTKSSDGVPTIRTTDMTAHGAIEITPETPRVLVSRESFDRFRVQRGDLLVTRTGSIGVMAVFDADYAAIPSAYLIRFRFTAQILPRYAFLVLTAPLGQQALGLSSTAITQPNINAEAIKRTPVALPSLGEQAEIVRRVETLFAFAHRLEARLTAAQSAIDRLTPALLAKAFRGELVPQDPADEPATELLKRLHAQTAQDPQRATPKRGRPGQQASA